MFRLLAAALFAFVTLPAAAQQGTVTIVVGFPAGATSDILSRLVAEEMRAKLGQPVIVENKAGAGGRIGNETVKAAKPDGTTLLMTPVATMSIYPHSFGELRYDPFKDFRPVAHLSDFQLGIGVAAQVPAKTLKEYVALVKKEPKQYGNYASAAAGSIPHFLGVLFARTAGIELTHVPYKGTAPALQALAGGEIAAISTVNADINRLVQAGRAKLLAVAGEKRDPAFPDVPTFKEAGYDMPAATPSWYALFAPAATPDAAVKRLSDAAIAAVKSESVNQRLTNMGLQPTGYGPEELGRIMKLDYERWGPVIKSSGFKPGG